MKDILKQLTEFYGPSGNEHMLMQSISSMFSQYCDSVKVDKFYNIIAVKKANPVKEAKYKVMFAAHMDEIGLIITDIDKKGFIKFISVGGVDPRILLSQEVIIHGKKKIFGVIGAKPAHLIEEDESKKPIKFENLYIDIGMSEGQAREVLSIGDIITFKADWTELQNELVSSKSLDNRAGVAVLVNFLKELANVKYDVDIICVATTQEELGLRGAIVSTYGINPDAVMVVDGCHGYMPGLDKEDTYELGKGPAIAIGPNIQHELVDYLKKVAKEENISYQIDVEPGNTGTDAWAVQVSRSGIPTLLVSFPLRYMHTTVETVSVKDLKNTSKLLSHFVKQLGQKLEEIRC